MANILIPPPRIPVIDSRTGMMAQAWYAFFAQFLQGARDDVDGLSTSMGALTARVLTAENDVDALQAENDGLFADVALAARPVAIIDELRKRIEDLETELSLIKSPEAAIDELRQRVREIETDLEMGL